MSFNEVYITYELHRRNAELEKLDRESAPYDHPLVERHRRAAALMDRFRRAWSPAAPVTSAERETREQPVICLNC